MKTPSYHYLNILTNNEVEILDLFEECIEAHRDPKVILSDELTEQYFKTPNNKSPITSWARIE
jgi:hypothetical protein